MPVHADHIAQQAVDLDLLILPELAAMSDAQCQAVRDFVSGGGSLVLTGNTACLDEDGQPRRTFPLADVVGIQHLDPDRQADEEEPTSWEEYRRHTYLRIPAAGSDSPRHPILQAFANTDILPFGGTFWQVQAESWLQTLATYIPPFPIYPPEFSWMRQPETDLPTILAGEKPNKSRIVYFAGDIDRCYGRAGLPDHGDLLGAAVRWAAGEPSILRVEGPGYLDCSLYEQDNRLVLHIVNLTGCNFSPGYVEAYNPVGPLVISVKLAGFTPQRILLRVADLELVPQVESGWAQVRLESLLHHELLVWE